jgi:hypothetical protein
VTYRSKSPEMSSELARVSRFGLLESLV